MKIFLLILVVSCNIFATGYIQRADVKTQAELITAGAASSAAIGTDQIWDSQNSKTLYQAIFDGDIGGGGAIIGSVTEYAGSTLPAGYLTLDGSSVSRTTYADLFAVIGIIYGPGDNSTTFGLPSARTTDFYTALNVTARSWRGMTTGRNGDVYAVVASGDIYKQTGGSGDFVALSQSALTWYGMTTALNGDVYASVYGGDIYKQTGGVGSFAALSQTTRNWMLMTTALNGDVYCATDGGDIYKQTGGVGSFAALSQTSRSWYGMATAHNGDVYASVASGDIYKQTGGVGSFAALGQTSRSWAGMTTSHNGDVYGSVTGGTIYTSPSYQQIKRIIKY